MIEGVGIFLLVCAVIGLIWLFVKISNKPTEDKLTGHSITMDAGGGKTKTLYPRDIEIMQKYKEAYLWASKVFGIHTNVFDDINDGMSYHRMMHKMTYAVYKYPTINRPKHCLYDSMKSVIIGGSGWEVVGAEEFMLEFIGITNKLRKDETMHILGKKYDVLCVVGMGK